MQKTGKGAKLGRAQKISVEYKKILTRFESYSGEWQIESERPEVNWGGFNATSISMMVFRGKLVGMHVIFLIRFGQYLQSKIFGFSISPVI